jgi:hypothetical protein
MRLIIYNIYNKTHRLDNNGHSLKFFQFRREGEMIMSPLFTEKQEESLKKSGKLITWKKKKFTEMKQNKIVFNQEMQD